MAFISPEKLLSDMLKPSNFACGLLLSYWYYSHLPVMANWVTKKVILDFLFLLHVENSTTEFPTMVKMNRTHRVISCSVCKKQSSLKQSRWRAGASQDRWYRHLCLELECGFLDPSLLPSPPQPWKAWLLYISSGVNWCKQKFFFFGQVI